MMVDLSEDDSFVTCQDRFEKLQPMIAIGQHATRDDSDESLERTGKCRLPSRSLEMVVHTVTPPTDLEDTAVHVAIDRRMSSHTIIRRAWEERVVRLRMRALLKKLIAMSKDKRPCGAMERPVRGRPSSARGSGERSRPEEGVVSHKICRCECEAFVSTPQNERKCQSCGHYVHEHQTLTRAEGHRIRRKIAQAVVKEHS